VLAGLVRANPGGNGVRARRRRLPARCEGTRRRDGASPKAGHYDRLLYVLLTALAAVQGETVENENDLLGWALRREREVLDKGIESTGCGQLKGRTILQCAAVATLAG
jgi:hypothetical protein